MTTTTDSNGIEFKNQRDAMLSLGDVGESMNAFGYGLRLMISLRKGTITSKQYDLLCGDLQMHCKKIGEIAEIQEENFKVSLF